MKSLEKGVIMDNEIKVIASNKKAFHNYFISFVAEAGIALEGSEVKSIRLNGISLNESYVFIKNGEIFLKNAYIKSYDHAAAFKPDERRDRKLLLHKREISKFEKAVKEKGFSMVATKVYLSKGKVKVEVALAKGKKLFDKRETLKERAVNREIERFTKTGGR